MTVSVVSAEKKIVWGVPKGSIYMASLSQGSSDRITEVNDWFASGTVSFFENFENNQITRKIESVWRKYYKNKDTVKSIGYQTKENAELFYKLISLHTTVEPDVAGYPNGEIGFDWESEKGTISVLIDEKKIYFYALSKSGKRRKGSEVWGKAVPVEILKYLGDFLGNE